MTTATTLSDEALGMHLVAHAHLLDYNGFSRWADSAIEVYDTYNDDLDALSLCRYRELVDIENALLRIGNNGSLLNGIQVYLIWLGRNTPANDGALLTAIRVLVGACERLGSACPTKLAAFIDLYTRYDYDVDVSDDPKSEWTSYSDKFIQMIKSCC